MTKQLNLTDMISELMQVCGQYEIPRGQIRITCGGASVIHMLRETTNDIDVDVCSMAEWNKLLKIPGITTKHYPALGLFSAADVVSIGNVDFHWRKENLFIHKSSRPVFTFAGFLVSTKLELLEDRIKLGREKDMKDIELLSSEYDNLSDVLKQRLYNTSIGFQKIGTSE